MPKIRDDYLKMTLSLSNITFCSKHNLSLNIIMTFDDQNFCTHTTKITSQTRMQLRQFVRRTAICTDEILVTLSILKSKEHAHAAHLNRVPLRSFFAGWSRRVGMLI